METYVEETFVEASTTNLCGNYFNGSLHGSFHVEAFISFHHKFRECRWLSAPLRRGTRGPASIPTARPNIRSVRHVLLRVYTADSRRQHSAKLGKTVPSIVGRKHRALQQLRNVSLIIFPWGYDQRFSYSSNVYN